MDGTAAAVWVEGEEEARKRVDTAATVDDMDLPCGGKAHGCVVRVHAFYNGARRHHSATGSMRGVCVRNKTLFGLCAEFCGAL